MAASQEILSLVRLVKRQQALSTPTSKAYTMGFSITNKNLSLFYQIYLHLLRSSETKRHFGLACTTPKTLAAGEPDASTYRIEN